MALPPVPSYNAHGQPKPRPRAGEPRVFVELLLLVTLRRDLLLYVLHQGDDLANRVRLDVCIDTLRLLYDADWRCYSIVV